jgi:CPA1 family monovalent cation:H+ antiporter
VEAESLFNDGTGVVLFTIAVSAMGNGNLTVSSAIIDFLRLTVGGVACGLAIGLLLSLVTARIDDPQVEISLTGLASYGGYLVAEYLNFSGILCVVCSALVLGNYGRPRGMSEATQGAVHAFWSYIAFFLNSLIFVLIGLDVPRAGLLQHIGVIALAAVIVLVARAFTVYGLMALLLPVGRRVNLRWQHLTVWSGIRGAVAVALLLSLDSREADLAQVRDIVYGVVLASIVVQGTTVGALARLLLPRTVGEAAARS